MSNIRSLFDSSLGIQNILESQSTQGLPEAKQIASSVIRDANLEDIYTNKNFGNMVENLVCPDVGDGEILRADTFSQLLDSCANTLKNTNDPNVQLFLKEELYPLLQNEELLRTYSGLMIGG